MYFTANIFRIRGNNYSLKQETFFCITLLSLSSRANGFTRYLGFDSRIIDFSSCISNGTSSKNIGESLCFLSFLWKVWFNSFPFFIKSHFAKMCCGTFHYNIYWIKANSLRKHFSTFASEVYSHIHSHKFFCEGALGAPPPSNQLNHLPTHHIGYF